MIGRDPDPYRSSGSRRFSGSLAESSVPLFDHLAADYEAHFQVPHRRAYDQLAWELVEPLLPEPPALIIDAGCGLGRWAARFVDQGFQVKGIEQAPAMARAARARGLGDAFQVVEAPIEEVRVEAGSAALVVAMGALQYTQDPQTAVNHFAQWVRPGGWVCVLVDSFAGLILELLRTNRWEEAEVRLRSRRGVWRQGDTQADYHLLDRAGIQEAFTRAGLVDVRSFGLLVGVTAAGVDAFAEWMAEDEETVLGRERALLSEPLLADVGKQLLVLGRRSV